MIQKKFITSVFDVMYVIGPKESRAGSVVFCVEKKPAVA